MFNDKYSIIDFENFIKDIDLDIIVETGTKWGDSTIKFKKYCKTKDIVKSIKFAQKCTTEVVQKHGVATI